MIFDDGFALISRLLNRKYVLLAELPRQHMPSVCKRISANA